MPKSDRGRLDETLEFLRTYDPGGHMGMGTSGRDEVHAFASAFVQNRYGSQGLFKRNQPMHGFSQTMSLGKPYVGGESTPDRKQRRAVSLLDAAIKDSAGLVGVFGAPMGPRFAGNVRDTLVATMWKARLASGQAHGSVEPHRRWLTQLRLNPGPLLRICPLHIAGSTAQATGPGGAPADQNVLTFHLGYDIMNGVFEFQQGNPNHGLAVQAASVKAVHWSQVPGRTNNPNSGSFAQIHGTELGGAELMLTTQFTGCAFCFKPSGGQIYAAHISPAGGGGPAMPGQGQALARQLDGLVANVTGGDFANAAGGGAFHIYGRQHSNLPGPAAGGYPANGRMYMLGFAGPNGWQIWSQSQDDHRTITGVVQVL